ncbi:hypothetical protein DFH11DRAFT_1633902 [Phellopilus nigrolimitatus]|nr:hypothetical protein DFH11DRAFT_1633902 [Phellopilus nigrolimitatus]
MVGLFVTPSFEDIDWALALDICERTAWSETDAKSIAKSIRKELKYARPVEQLGAIMLWAIMLQNASDVFITQTSSRKFLDVVEDNITSPKTAMAVRERLLEVLGAAVHLSAERGGKDASKRENFRSLWRKVKPDGYPNEGMPLTTDNPMFRSKSGALHPDKYMNAVVDADNGRIRPPISDRRPSRSGIIPIDEDMRRLFQECKIGRGNAALLSEALAFASPDDLKEKDIIKEFYAKCRASKELVHAQISWASAGAEQSRLRQLEAADLRMNNTNELLSTREEKLLAELLKSNEELTEALKIYDDIERIGVEKEVERHATERSRSEFRAAALDSQGVGEASSFLHAASAAPSSSRSPSPASLLMASQASWVSSHSPYDVQNMEQVSPALTQPLPQPIAMSVSNSSHGHLAPGSLPAPFAGARSRSPSPAQASRPNSRDLSQNNSVDMAHGIGRVPLDHTSARNSRTFPIENGVALSEVDDPEPVTVRMSDKAAGKRKVREPDSEHQDGIREVSRSDELLHVELHDPPPPVFEADEGNTNESLPSVHWKPEVHFVYDAAAERTRERIREGMTYSV